MELSKSESSDDDIDCTEEITLTVTKSLENNLVYNYGQIINKNPLAHDKGNPQKIMDHRQELRCIFDAL